MCFSHTVVNGKSYRLAVKDGYELNWPQEVVEAGDLACV